MDNFDTTNSVLSAEDLLDGADFVEEFVGELANHPCKVAATPQESACARLIRDRLKQETGLSARMEAFEAYPLLGRGSLPILGIWFALCMVLYYISFVDNALASLLLTLFALLIFIAGSCVILLLFLGNQKLGRIMRGRVSYNVVSQVENNCDAEHKGNVVVVCDNHDDELGSFVKDFGKLRRITAIITPISMGLFVLFCILKMALGIDDPAKITVFTLLPAIFGGMGVWFAIARYSPSKKRAQHGNGVATAVAMTTFAYFAEQPQLLPEGSKLVYASFGAENSGHCGSSAFVRSHPEFADAQVLCISDIEGGALNVVQRDSLRGLHFDQKIIDTALQSAQEQQIQLSTLQNNTMGQKMSIVHGYMSNAFAKAGVASATLVAKDFDSVARVANRTDIEKLISLTIGTVSKLLGTQEQSTQQIEQEASSSIQIVGASGK